MLYIRPQVCQYLCNFFFRYFAPIIYRRYDKSYQLDHKNNYGSEYFKELDLEITTPKVAEAWPNKQTDPT